MDDREVARLVETYLWHDLKEAEEALIEGKDIDFEVSGNSQGARLLHISAAIWVLEMIRKESCELSVAMEAYRRTVR